MFGDVYKQIRLAAVGSGLICFVCLIFTLLLAFGYFQEIVDASCKPGNRCQTWFLTIAFFIALLLSVCFGMYHNASKEKIDALMHEAKKQWAYRTFSQPGASYPHPPDIFRAIALMLGPFAVVATLGCLSPLF